MSNFEQFMKANKKAKPNEKFAVTKSLCDKDGIPLEWEFKHITSKQCEDIRESCTVEVPTGKSNIYRQKTKSGLYIQRLIIASVVMPDLYNKELQDSYGVKTPEELLLAMVDDPGEYNRLVEFIQTFHGFDKTFDEKVDEAKN